MALTTAVAATRSTSITAPTSVAVATSMPAQIAPASDRQVVAPAPANGSQTSKLDRSAGHLLRVPAIHARAVAAIWGRAPRRSRVVVVAAPSVETRRDARRKWIARVVRRAATRCRVQAAGNLLRRIPARRPAAPVAGAEAEVALAAAVEAAAPVVEVVAEVAVAAVVVVAVVVAAVVARRWP